MSISVNWTYTGDPANSDRDAVRFLVGDTDPDDKKLTDGEVEWAIAEEANVYYAAAECCRSIAATFASKVSKAVGDLRIQYGERQQHYSDLAINLRARGNQQGNVYCGGISKDDQDSYRNDSDRRRAIFSVGMHDNDADDLDELRDDI